MGIKSMVEGFILRIALKKGVKAAVGAIISIKGLAAAGVTVDATALEQFLLSAGTGAVAMALNYLKIKTKLGAKFL